MDLRGKICLCVCETVWVWSIWTCSDFSPAVKCRRQVTQQDRGSSTLPLSKVQKPHPQLLYWLTGCSCAKMAPYVYRLIMMQWLTFICKLPFSLGNDISQIYKIFIGESFLNVLVYSTFMRSTSGCACVTHTHTHAHIK